MRYKIGLLIALLLAMVGTSDAQLIREELIPASITRDSEIVPTGVANALCITNPGPTFNVAFCSTVDVTGKTVLYKIPEYTIANLPASNPLAIATNCLSASDCTTTGTVKVVVWWNGTAWTPLGSGGGGAGTGDIESVTAGTGMTGGGTTGALTLNVAGTAPITVAADAVECPTCATTAAALTANLPVIGAGANATAVGTRSGNTTQFASVTGTKTTSMQLAFDVNGNVIASASGIGVGFSGLVAGNLPQAQAPTGPLVPSSVSEDTDSVNLAKPGEICPSTCLFALDTSVFASTLKTWGFPTNANATFVGHNTTQTLTNKTMDGASNTFTNLPTAAMVTALKTKSITFRIGSDSGAALVDTQDEANVWSNNIAAMTITEIKAWTDQGTSTINIQRDDGTPANICSSNLVASSPSGATCTLAGAEDNLAVGDKLNFTMIQAATTGSPKRITVSIKGVLD